MSEIARHNTFSKVTVLAHKTPINNPGDYYCSSCRSLMIDPHESNCCGILMCVKCIHLTCECRADAGYRLTFNTKKKIMKLWVQCLHIENGCKHECSLQDMMSHDNKCEYKRVQCRKCSKVVLNSELNTHLNNDCDIKINCPCKSWSGCDFTGTRAVVNEHAKSPHIEKAEKYVSLLKEANENTTNSFTSGIQNLKEQIAQLKESELKEKNRSSRLGGKVLEVEAENERLKDKIKLLEGRDPLSQLLGK